MAVSFYATNHKYEIYSYGYLEIIIIMYLVLGDKPRSRERKFARELSFVLCYRDLLPEIRNQPFDTDAVASSSAWQMTHAGEYHHLPSPPLCLPFTIPHRLNYYLKERHYRYPSAKLKGRIHPVVVRK